MNVAVASRPMSVQRPRTGVSRFVMTGVSLHVLITSGHGETSPADPRRPRIPALPRELFGATSEDRALGAGAVRSRGAAARRRGRGHRRGLPLPPWPVLPGHTPPPPFPPPPPG